MAWNNSNELVLGGGGQVNLAPVGTTLPTSPTGNLNSAFVGLGYHSEDGVALSTDPDITTFMAWQSRQPVRRELNTFSVRAAFELLQWDEDTVKAAFGGGVVTDLGSGNFKFTPPDPDDGLAEYAAVIDIDDGSERWRHIFPRVSVAEGVESTFNRSDLASLAVTLEALAPADGGDPWYFLTNSSAFAAGS